MYGYTTPILWVTMFSGVLQKNFMIDIDSFTNYHATMCFTV